MFGVFVSTSVFQLKKTSKFFTLKFGCHPPKGVTRYDPHQPHPPPNATVQHSSCGYFGDYSNEYKCSNSIQLHNKNNIYFQYNSLAV